MIALFWNYHGENLFCFSMEFSVVETMWEREREREIERHTHTHTHTERERERERERFSNLILHAVALFRHGLQAPCLGEQCVLPGFFAGTLHEGSVLRVLDEWHFMKAAHRQGAVHTQHPKPSNSNFVGHNHKFGARNFENPLGEVGVVQGWSDLKDSTLHTTVYHNSISVF